MLDRVTPRTKMRDELITITRMLLGLPPEVKGDLPAPEAAPETAPEAGDKPEAEKAKPEAAKKASDSGTSPKT